jgi:hypothetical protein
MVLLLALAWLLPAPAAQADTDIDGLVSCGLPSGERCDVQNVLQIRTDALGAPRQIVDIDIAWVKDRLGSFDQDDLVCLTVERAPAGGLRAIGLIEPCGTEGTVNAGLSTGSHTAQERGRRPKEDDVPRNDAPTPTPSTPGGLVSGTVTDALSGAPLGGVQVTVTTANGATFSTTTSASGQYSIGNLVPGTVTVGFTLSGFTSVSRTVQIVQSQTTNVSVALAPNTAGAPIQIVLTWGAAPVDLDAHLSGPTSGGGRFHANFANPSPVSYASLDHDDKDGFGPETITIRSLPGTTQFVPGEYRFWAQNFGGTPGFDVSNASVAVSQGGRQLATFPVSGASGDPRLGIWQVVTLTVDAAGTVTLTPVQQYQPGDDVTVLTKGPASK